MTYLPVFSFFTSSARPRTALLRLAIDSVLALSSRINFSSEDNRCNTGFVLQLLFFRILEANVVSPIFIDEVPL